MNLLPRAPRSAAHASSRLTHVVRFPARPRRHAPPSTTTITTATTAARPLSTSASRAHAIARSRHPPPRTDRSPPPPSDPAPPTMDWAAMDVLAHAPPPTTAVDACLHDGFALDSGLRVRGAGVLLVAGECFRWRPWVCGGGGGGGTAEEEKEEEEEEEEEEEREREEGLLPLLRAQGTPARPHFHLPPRAWGVLDLCWPKPDLLILGTGPTTLPLTAHTRRDVAALGIRLEVLDTRNAAAQFNLLATERGTQQVAAALVPVGWREGGTGGGRGAV